MIDEELLNKFDRIADLPVSEEMLGAYLEGKLDTIEASHVEFAMSEDSVFSNFIDCFSSHSGSILDNMEHVLFDPQYPHFLLDVELPSIESDMLQGNLYEDHMVAACCPEDFFNDLYTQFSEDLISSDHLIEENLPTDDSFIGTDQSLDIDSQECDDMFNEDSIDM